MPSGRLLAGLISQAYLISESLSGGRGQGHNFISLKSGQYTLLHITSVIQASVTIPDLNFGKQYPLRMAASQSSCLPEITLVSYSAVTFVIEAILYNVLLNKCNYRRNSSHLQLRQSLLAVNEPYILSGCQQAMNMMVSLAP